MENIGILVLGHGSSLPFNKELVETYAALIRKSHPGPVRTAYLNMNEPRIPEGLKSFVGLKVKKIVALPIFLAHGVHTMQDIPRELGVDEQSRRSIVKYWRRRGGGHLCRSIRFSGMHCCSRLQTS